MIKLPQNVLIRAIYRYLEDENVGCNIYDDIPQNAMLPYATFGVATTDDFGAKCVDASQTSIEIHIYSDSQGRKELNDIAERIINKLSGVLFDMTDDGFSHQNGKVSNFVSEPEDTEGYHGIITYDALIQYVGGEINV